MKTKCQILTSLPELHKVQSHVSVATSLSLLHKHDKNSSRSSVQLCLSAGPWTPPVPHFLSLSVTVTVAGKNTKEKKNPDQIHSHIQTTTAKQHRKWGWYKRSELKECIANGPAALFMTDLVDSHDGTQRHGQRGEGEKERKTKRDFFLCCVNKPTCVTQWCSACWMEPKQCR